MLRFTWRRPAQLSLVASILLLGACASAQTPRGRGDGYYVVRPPPRAVAEVVTVAPGPRYAWIPGHYIYARNDYVWRPGHWDVIPSGFRRWEAARWARDRRRGWYFVDGRWR